MSKELPKACPFCDEDCAGIKVTNHPTVDGFPVSVECIKCGARGPVIVTNDMDNNDAVYQWNTRPTEDRLTRMVLSTEKRFR